MTKHNESDLSETYDVVINNEEQYSIWSTNRDIPSGWRKANFQGDRQACLQYISEVWTDMRPKSLRDQMEQKEQQHL